MSIRILLSWRSDSNRRPADYKGVFNFCKVLCYNDLIFTAIVFAIVNKAAGIFICLYQVYTYC